MDIKKTGFFIISQGKPLFPESVTFGTLIKYLGRLMLFSILVGVSWSYRGLVQLRLTLYRVGILKSITLPCPVLSIGNITTGGTGKTPMVILVARILQRHGKRVAVLSRGYHRKNTTAEPVVVSVEGNTTDVQNVGDEPWLIARQIASPGSNGPAGLVVIGRKRVRSGQFALTRFQPDVLLLDDGFQHVQLARTRDIVLIDATNPFGKGVLLPAGLLREPVRNLRRAHAFVITRSDEVPDITPIRQRVQSLHPQAPIFTARHTFAHIRDTETGATVDRATLQGQRVLAVCGIANPVSFQRVLQQLDMAVVSTLDFPDHHWFTDNDIDRIRDHAIRQQTGAIVTTEKDLPRLQRHTERLKRPLYVVAITMCVEPAREFEVFVMRNAEYIKTNI